MSDDIIARAEAALALRWEQPGPDYPEPVPTGLVWLGDWASEHLSELVAELKTTRAQLEQAREAVNFADAILSLLRYRGLVDSEQNRRDVQKASEMLERLRAGGR